MAEQFGEKSQEATPFRRQKAREEGQVARSQDLASAALLVGATLTMMYFLRGVTRYLGVLTERQLGDAAWLRADPHFVVAQSDTVLIKLAQVLLPIFGLLLILAILVHLLQVGILFVPQKLAPDLSRISPLKGAARLFSLSNVVRLGFGLFKITVVAAVAAWSIWDHHGAILSMTVMPIAQLVAVLSDILLGTCLRIGMALLVLAIFDYAYQRWKHEQDLRMTTQEVREEMKTLQGDPQVLARRRFLQRQLVLNRLQSTVPKADVVVTNPTHLAVAIQYDPETMQAPIVVAKGAGVLAERIRRLALESDIPIVERKPLARALYQNVDVNQPIPAAQYAAVAEILRYVYELKGKTPPAVRQAA